METNKLFHSNSNKILQTPSASILFFRANLVFLVSKYKGESDLSLCMSSPETCKKNAAAQWRLPTNCATKHVSKSEVGTAQPHFLSSPEVMHRPESDSPLHFDIKNAYRSRTENRMLALGICFPQSYLSLAASLLFVKIAFVLQLIHLQ